MHRREFLMTATAALTCSSSPAADPPADPEKLAREHLRAILPTRERVSAFLTGQQGGGQPSRNSGWKYDADLGWVLCDAVRPDGVDRSRTFYHYEVDGARKVVNFPDKPCRIHTYGNSFTHCDQVSDGETWQEYLAAHFQEPIRNYGVGGYSVYQAYRRMLKVEKDHPAPYLILNIFDDDHFRNLDSWRSIRFGRRSACGFTLPHLRIDVAKGRCEQVENYLRQPDDVYRLCDEEFVFKTFRDDQVLKLLLAAANKETLSRKLVEPLAVSFGIPEETLKDTDAARRIRTIHTEAALFATRNVLTWTEQFAAKTGKKLLVVLSFSRPKVEAELEGKPRFDQTLLDWLKTKSYPVIDMRDAFRADFGQHRGDVGSYLNRFYIGHHTPAGNFFTAWALKQTLVKWLDPPPLPYRP